jgi:hypothetical protein
MHGPCLFVVAAAGPKSKIRWPQVAWSLVAYERREAQAQT